MRTRASRSALLVLAMAAAASGCGNQTTTPTPVLATETLTGTLNVLGSASKNFTVNYAQAATDASITVTSLTTVADNTPLSVTIGVAFGSLAFDGSCTRAATYTANAATIGQELVATGAFGPGPYCVAIFDNGTLTEATNWTITLKHLLISVYRYIGISINRIDISMHRHIDRAIGTSKHRNIDASLSPNLHGWIGNRLAMIRRPSHRPGCGCPTAPRKGW